MSIKLVVLDIDGTIAGVSNQINPTVVRTIHQVQSRGIQVALATGRMFSSALRFHQTIQSTLPLISYNGALTKHPHTGTVLREKPLPTAIALEILAHFERPDLQPHLDIHCYYNDQLHVRHITPETHIYMERSGAMAQASGDLRSIIELGSTTKMLAISRNAPLMAQLMAEMGQKLRGQAVHLTQSTEIYFEVTHAEATKGLAQKHLAEDVLKLDPHEILAIGDNFNDVEMLKYAGVGVAMGNAPPEVQKVADWVTADVEADGVSQALAKFCLDSTPALC